MHSRRRLELGGGGRRGAQLPHRGAPRTAHRRARRAAVRAARCLPAAVRRPRADRSGLPGAARGAAGDAARAASRGGSRVGVESLRRGRRAPGARGRPRSAGADAHRHRPSRSSPKRSCSARAPARSGGASARVDPQAILRDLQDLNPGAPVVHEEYGVGRYVGLMAMEIAGQPGEFLVLEYLGGDRVYVPVHALHLVSRYTGAAPESAPLHKLGTDQWARARKRAAEQIRDVAAELLDLYARRKAQRGLHARRGGVRLPGVRQRLPLRGDRGPGRGDPPGARRPASERPMDRIVCGDVGFGKTEVAMRAAFVAVQAGKQVAVLVPTTLLAQQHLANFRDRFADWPVRIEALSRFRTAKETHATHRGHGAGQGRHRHRHASPAAHARALQGPRAHHHRRGAPLRRARQGAPAGTARRTCTC